MWWLCGNALSLLLWIARATASMPGAVAALPAMPNGVFAMMASGGLWIALWRTRVRWLGVLPLALGGVLAVMTPSPDLIVTGDGRHLAIRTPDGNFALLRERAGDYVRGVLAEVGGVDTELPVLDDVRGARCNADLCLVDVARGGRNWRLLATRSPYFVDAGQLIAACRRADIVVSERRLPRACNPSWLKLDRGRFATTGGVTVTLSPARLRTVTDGLGSHPWVRPPVVFPERPAGK